MSVYRLVNVHNDLNGYNQLVRLYEEHKEDLFETIELELAQWFDANLSAVLGAILDRFKDEGLNSVEFVSIMPGIQTVLQKNGFLAGLFCGRFLCK